jgi:hypothetical protein
MPLEAADLRPIVAAQRATKQAIAQACEELAETRAELDELKQLIRRLRPTRGLARIKTFTAAGYGDTSERTIYRWEEEGRIRLIRIGGTVYVDLDHWFDQIERLRAEQAAAAEQKAAQSGRPPDNEDPELKHDTVPPARNMGR